MLCAFACDAIVFVQPRTLDAVIAFWHQMNQPPASSSASTRLSVPRLSLAELAVAAAVQAAADSATPATTSSIVDTVLTALVVRMVVCASDDADTHSRAVAHRRLVLASLSDLQLTTKISVISGQFASSTTTSSSPSSSVTPPTTMSAIATDGALRSLALFDLAGDVPVGVLGVHGDTVVQFAHVMYGNTAGSAAALPDDTLRLSISSMTFVHWQTRTNMLLALLWCVCVCA
jgi:hypothetical protein